MVRCDDVSRWHTVDRTATPPPPSFHPPSTLPLGEAFRPWRCYRPNSFPVRTIRKISTNSGNHNRVSRSFSGQIERLRWEILKGSKCLFEHSNHCAQNFEQERAYHRVRTMVIEKQLKAKHWNKHEDSLKFLRILDCLFKYSY